ncbi:MAG: hypothetical protein P2A85_05730 [Microcoleus anatoxicus]|uniref:hypothetical protein n=1 Tax=Microcoleus anatoxicus TaxID=2705319 RepID=UPI00366A73A5
MTCSGSHQLYPNFPRSRESHPKNLCAIAPYAAQLDRLQVKMKEFVLVMSIA